jgi:hypothetical protein
MILILALILFVGAAVALFLAWRCREDALDYLWEARQIVERNNAILRQRTDPIEIDGKLNPVFFTKEIIEVTDACNE